MKYLRSTKKPQLNKTGTLNLQLFVMCNIESEIFNNYLFTATLQGTKLFASVFWYCLGYPIVHLRDYWWVVEWAISKVLWEFLPLPIMLEIWKERYRRIFEHSAKFNSFVIFHIIYNITVWTSSNRNSYGLLANTSRISWYFKP